MLPRPDVDLVRQPDPAGLQARDWDREVVTSREPMHLLATDPQDLSDLRDTSQPEAIHSRRLETTCLSSPRIGNLRHL